MCDTLVCQWDPLLVELMEVAEAAGSGAAPPNATYPVLSSNSTWAGRPGAGQSPGLCSQGSLKASHQLMKTHPVQRGTCQMDGRSACEHRKDRKYFTQYQQVWALLLWRVSIFQLLFQAMHLVCIHGELFPLSWQETS